MNKAKYPVNRTEDARLLARFVSEHDELAYARLVRKYEKLVWCVCCRILDNRCDAEDAFQSTFVLLATKARRIRKPKSLASWLYGVAYRTAHSIRRQRHRDAVSYEESVDPSSHDDVLEQVARKNENELVFAELMMLAEKLKTPLLMHYFVGKSTSQIARSLGLTVVAVESRLKRGRRALKTRLLMRGVSSDSFAGCFAILPVFAMSESLVGQTVSSSLAASVGQCWGSTLSNCYGTLNQTGVKLMILKTTIACSLVCLVGLGVAMHSGAFAGGDEPLVLTMSDADHPTAATSMEVVVDDKSPASHADKIHSFIGAHVHWLFSRLHNAPLHKHLEAAHKHHAHKQAAHEHQALHEQAESAHQHHLHAGVHDQHFHEHNYDK